MLKPKMCRGRAPGAFSERSLWLKNPAKCLDNKGWISTAPRVSKIDIQTDAVEPHCVKVQSCSHKSFCFFRALSNPLLQNRPFALIHPILRWSQVKSNFVIAKCCKMMATWQHGFFQKSSHVAKEWSRCSFGSGSDKSKLQTNGHRKQTKKQACSSSLRLPSWLTDSKWAL